ncbi:MAG: sialate O-acetylesterase [Chthoniobacter sp.]|nr:sialate O-acetylesterase [Chthoniobacter sp.]
MKTKPSIGNLVALVIAGLVLQATAANDIPAMLSRPDSKPGDASKPVKVYILAGQSNMVGMGDITGARPLYPSIFLSADPRIVPGTMPVGGFGLAAHAVYQTTEAKSGTGALVALHKGAYDPKIDYNKLTPAQTSTVALGTASEKLPSFDGPHTVVVSAAIDVPVTGIYTVHAGFDDSSYNVVVLEGKEVYRKEPGGKPVIAKITLEQGRRYPLTMTYFRSGSAAFWLEQVDLGGKGDLETVTKTDHKFTYLLDEAGKWTERHDVFYKEARLHPEGGGSPLSANSNNGRSIGPELGFGSVVGTFHDEQVLLIKTAQGNRSLGFDFRPPSSGPAGAADENEGMEYRLMVKGVRETLDHIDKIMPGYKGQGYEIAGFGWFQGHKDSGSTKEDYEKNLVNLINDLRKEFKAPKMPVVVATVGFNGYRLAEGPWKGVWEAQMAVGDAKQHSEFAGTVTSVDTRDFWRDVGESPREQDYHYNRNAETYLLVGETMGRAMVRLQGGKAEVIPKSDREARTAARVAAEAARTIPTEDQKAASLAAIKPMILDGALMAFATNPRYQPALKEALKGEKPERPSQYLDDTLDEAVTYYREAGISDYDWKPVRGDLNGPWEYYAFDLPPAEDKTKGISDLKLTCPAGMEDWFAPGFDAKGAGWKSGGAPFGVLGDAPLVPIPDWYKGSKRDEPTTAYKGDVLLLRRSFDLPPVKEGWRYRIRVAGSGHANLGEGFAIYVNGKLLAESKAGVAAWRREGKKPRGGHVWADFRDQFKGGKVTIALSNFPMNNRTPNVFIPVGAPLSIWLEEMKLPPFAE